MGKDVKATKMRHTSISHLHELFPIQVQVSYFTHLHLPFFLVSDVAAIEELVEEHCKGQVLALYTAVLVLQTGEMVNIQPTRTKMQRNLTKSSGW